MRVQILDPCDVVDSPGIKRSIADQARTIRIPVHMRMAMPEEKIRKILKISGKQLDVTASGFGK